ncbi:MAG: hypothetical protein ACKPE3_06435 [Sphaerospermopsis kisseleviana]
MNNPIPNTQCPMPNAQCPMPNAQCPMTNEGLLNKPKILVNQKFEADQEERKCKIFEGYTLKTVHFGSDKLENLGITDS